MDEQQLEKLGFNKRFVQPMDFCKVVSKKATKNTPINIGDVVLVATMKPAPEKRSDPYLQRIYAVVLLIKDGKILIPKDDNEHQSWVLDPRFLEHLEEEEEQQFMDLLENGSTD